MVQAIWLKYTRSNLMDFTIISELMIVDSFIFLVWKGIFLTFISLSYKNSNHPVKVIFPRHLIPHRIRIRFGEGNRDL
jgi:hypothetical protein